MGVGGKPRLDGGLTRIRLAQARPLAAAALLLAALALLAAPRVSDAAATPGNLCVSGMPWCSITFTTTASGGATTPKYMGVNLGHHHPSDSSWLAFIEHLGVNSACQPRPRLALH